MATIIPTESLYPLDYSWDLSRKWASNYNTLPKAHNKPTTCHLKSLLKNPKEKGQEGEDELPDHEKQSKKYKPKTKS